MKTWLSSVSCLVFSGLAASVLAGNAGDAVADYFGAGELKLSAGGVFSLHNYGDSAQSGRGIGLGFMEVRYVTPETYGLQFGAWWFALKKVWENHDGDFERYCKDDNDLRKLYAQWAAPSTKTAIKGGRFLMNEMPGLDGNSHQGVQVVCEDVPGVRLRAGVVNRWVNNSRIHMNFLGMSGWEDVDSVHEEAGQELWLGSSKFDLPGGGYIEPFIAYQQNVMLLYGADADLPVEIAEGRTVGLDGTFSVYGNKTPRDIEPDYQDVYSWLIHGYYAFNDIKLGLGWYGVSNHRGDLGAGIFDWIDPLTVDETMPYDDYNNAQLYYTDAKIKLAPCDIVLRYGYGNNKAYDIKSHEINALVFYNITKSVQLSAFVSWNRYSGDMLSDYTRIGSVLRYTY